MPFDKETLFSFKKSVDDFKRRPLEGLFGFSLFLVSSLLCLTWGFKVEQGDGKQIFFAGAAFMLCFAFFLLLEPFFLRADKEIFRVFPQGVEALLVKGDAENVREKFFLSFQDVESLSKDCDGDIVFTTASGKTLCISNSSQYYSKISKVFQDFKEKNGQVRN